MTPDEVARIIEDDLKRNCLNWNGRPFRDCLRTPEKVRVGNPLGEGGTEEVWLVFEESATPEKGYRVVFDEEAGLFGLAVPGTPNLVVIGLYGGFVKTLQSM